MQSGEMDESDKAEALAALRLEIDRIDGAVIALLGERARFVEKVGKLKPNPDKVRVPERERQVIERACQLAIEHGIAPSFVEQLYLSIIDYFVSHEQDHMRREAAEKASKES